MIIFDEMHKKYERRTAVDLRHKICLVRSHKLQDSVIVAIESVTIERQDKLINI